MSNNQHISEDETQSDDGVEGALAPLLVRISALARVAVPVHRFAFPETNADGVELAHLDPANQAIELWKSRFLDGEAFIIDITKVGKPDLPLLWVLKTAQGFEAKIIRGFKIKGSWSKVPMACQNISRQTELQRGRQ